MDQDDSNLIDKARDVGADAKERLSGVDDKFKKAVPKKRRGFVVMIGIAVVVFAVAGLVKCANAATVFALMPVAEVQSCDDFKQEMVDRELVKPDEYGNLPALVCEEVLPPAPEKKV